MDDDFVILHPTTNHTNSARKGLPPRFVAVGTAPRGAVTFVRVRGEIEKHGTDDAIGGETILWALRTNPADRLLYHWMILFDSDRIEQGERYKLTVYGFKEGDTVGTPIYCHAFDIRPVEIISVDYPPPETNITSEYDRFVAQGPCTHDADSAHMNSLDDPDVTFEASWLNTVGEGDDRLWVAVFPELARGHNYQLFVRDTWNHPALVEPLTVDP